MNFDEDQPKVGNSKSKIIAKKPKTLRINTEQSIIESNLAELPFIYYYKQKDPINILEYVWYDSKGVKRGLEVRNPKYGIPSAFEYSVLMGLFRIFVKNNPIIEFNEEKGVYDMPIEIYFTFKDLAEEMGYHNFGGSIKARIEQAIECLVDTTIYNRYNGGMLDQASGEYVIDSKKAFHIIEEYESYNYKELHEGEKRVDGNKVKDRTRVRLSNFFYNSMCNNYYRKYNYTQALSLKSGIAKKLMLMLDKWKGNRANIELYYETLYQRIPLIDTKSISYRNKCIRNAADDLVRVGFIQNYISDDKKKKINFIFDKDSLDDNGHDKDTYCARDKYNSFFEIMQGFRDFGFSNEEAEKSLDLKRLPYIKALLRSCYIKQQYKAIDTPHGYIYAGLQKPGYNNLDKFYDEGFTPEQNE
jgi:hypothetical protein